MTPHDEHTADPLEAPPAAPLPEGFKSGFATLVGQPNAGKSTLVNALLGQKLAIVSPRPQTTRDAIRAIVTTPTSQVVFVDTPGVHAARSLLNRAMVGTAIEAMESVDVVVLVVDAVKAVRHLQKNPVAPGSWPPAAITEPDEGDAAKPERGPEHTYLHPGIHPADRRVIRALLRYTQRWMIAINKVDRVKKPKLLAVLEAYGSAPHVGPLVPISALRDDGLDRLMDALLTYLPEAPPPFPSDELTDRSTRFLLAELLREQVFLQTREEVPYGVAVEIEHLDESTEQLGVHALVHVEKPAQRGILLGAKGHRMKAMSTAARHAMQELLDRRIHLEVHVRVEPKWTEKVHQLRRFGYNIDG